VPFDPAIVDYLQRELYLTRGVPMRACHPRDLIEQVVNQCRYQGREALLTRDLLDEACRTYFIDTAEITLPGLEPASAGVR
jgi:hypothetical protein